MVVAALVITLELMMTRNAEPIVGNPLKDGEKTSYVVIVCFSDYFFFLTMLLLLGIMCLARG